MHQVTVRSVCDNRCTSARGPGCECACGGKNHGSSLWVVETRDAGGIPRVTPRDGKAGAIRDEWRGALATFTAAFDASRFAGPVAAKRRGEWIADFGTYLAGERILDGQRKARHMTSQAGRLRALRELTAALA